MAADLMTRGKAPAFCSADKVVYRARDEGKQFALDSHRPLPRPSAPSSMPTSMNASATTASLTSSPLTCRSNSSAASGVRGNTAWFGTRVAALTVSVDANTSSSAGLSTGRSRLQVSGSDHEASQGELQGSTQGVPRPTQAIGQQLRAPILRLTRQRISLDNATA